jgi:hypothetical protein
MKRVLVFPCGSEIGLEYCRALAYSTFFEIHGAGSIPDHGAFAYDSYHGGLPFADDPGFLSALRKLLQEQRIDFLVPAHDSLTVSLSEWQQSGLLDGVRVVGSSSETSRIARSKSLTYEALRNVVRVPQTFLPSDPYIQFPVFLKPDIGQGSRGTRIARNAAEFAEALRQEPGLIACELLTGPEYTVDCFSDRHGTLRFAGGRSRCRVYGGISVNTKAVEDPRFMELATAIHGALDFRGQWFFQVKERASGELVLLEIATRCSGTSGYFRLMGVNLPLLSLHDAAGQDVAVKPNCYSLEIDRALATRARIDCEFRDVFVDLDDTLLWRGGINHRLIGVLYRFRNEGRRLHLLTRHGARHAEGAPEALENHAISPRLFERIIEVPEESKKSDLIDRGDAILIDDSFAERLEVAESRSLPVFDINQAIELFGDFH